MTALQTLNAANTALNAARFARAEASRAEARAACSAGACPTCGGAIRRNLAIRGWVQCAQYGAPGFRLDATRAACSWQGFTE